MTQEQQLSTYFRNELERFANERDLAPIEQILIGGSTRINGRFVNTNIAEQDAYKGFLEDDYFKVGGPAELLGIINQNRRKKGFVQTQALFGLDFHEMLYERGLRAGIALKEVNEQGFIPREIDFVIVNEELERVGRVGLVRQLRPKRIPRGSILRRSEDKSSVRLVYPPANQGKA